jgi:hypothetical protein
MPEGGGPHSRPFWTRLCGDCGLRIPAWPSGRPGPRPFGAGRLGGLGAGGLGAGGKLFGRGRRKGRDSRGAEDPFYLPAVGCVRASDGPRSGGRKGWTLCFRSARESGEVEAGVGFRLKTMPSHRAATAVGRERRWMCRRKWKLSSMLLCGTSPTCKKPIQDTVTTAPTGPDQKCRTMAWAGLACFLSQLEPDSPPALAKAQSSRCHRSIPSSSRLATAPRSVRSPALKLPGRAGPCVQRAAVETVLGARRPRNLPGGGP